MLTEIKTDRLTLHCLTLAELKLWLTNPAALEKALNCQCQAPAAWFSGIVQQQMTKIEKSPENLIYLSFWFIICQSDGQVLGTIDFKNVPDEVKTVEIGYGLDNSAFSGQGYMTETVRAFCQNALQDDKISKIIAETERDNLASARVLEKSGFIKYNEEKTSWWELEK